MSWCEKYRMLPSNYVAGVRNGPYRCYRLRLEHGRLRLRTLDAATAHSQGCECALSRLRVRSHERRGVVPGGCLCRTGRVPCVACECKQKGEK